MKHFLYIDKLGSSVDNILPTIICRNWGCDDWCDDVFVSSFQRIFFHNFASNIDEHSYFRSVYISWTNPRYLRMLLISSYLLIRAWLVFIIIYRKEHQRNIFVPGIIVKLYLRWANPLISTASLTSFVTTSDLSRYSTLILATWFAYSAKSLAFLITNLEEDKSWYTFLFMVPPTPSCKL